MCARLSTRWWLTVVIGVMLVAGIARAEFVLVEDFEDIPWGPIDGQNDWYAPSDSSTVTTDPNNAGNNVLSVVTESTILRKDLLLFNGTIRMFFMRFRFAEQLNYSVGLSDAVVPSQFDHFEVELSQTNSTNELRINDGGNYEVLTILEPDTWYNCWLLVDHVADETTVWLHARPGQDATGEDLQMADGETTFEFRNPNTSDLKKFYIKTGGGNGVAGPLYIDDLSTLR